MKRLCSLLLAFSIGSLFSTTYSQASLDVNKLKGQLAWKVKEFADLSRWENDAFQESLSHLLWLRESLQHRSPEDPFHTKETIGLFGRVRDWCCALEGLPGEGSSSSAVRSFFEQHFLPVSLHEGSSELIGYSASTYVGRSSKDATYSTPLLRLPDTEEERTMTRAEWLHHQELQERYALVWLRPIDAYFAQKQGVANIMIKGKRELLNFVYAGDNDHPYISIEPPVSETGQGGQALATEELRKWVHMHPQQSSRLLGMNPSYTYFPGSFAIFPSYSWEEYCCRP